MVFLRTKDMHNSKVCFKCNENKELTKFYKHKNMLDGHLNKCKDCTKKDAILHYSKNKEYYKEYDRCRGMLPNRVESRRIYSQTEEGKEKHRKAKKKWTESNIVKKAASTIIGNALRSGKIIKPELCEICEIKHERIHGHHDDYAYPMEVRWLCPKCHTKWHKENGAGLNG